MNKMLKLLFAVALCVLGFSSARATDVDYGAILSTNLDTINTIWAAVATIMIASALVAVGVRFFRKAK